VRKFARRRGLLTTHLNAYEVELLSSLVSQLVELVSDGEPGGFEVTERAPEDPFEAIVADLEVEPDEPEQSEDPVLKRLFPTAYPDDPVASSDFRRFTERQLKAKKVADAQVVLDRLAGTEQGRHELRIPPEEVDAWLRTLTSVRLAVATRLGITDAEAADRLTELPEEDPRTFMVSVYDWLGFAEETMISALR
jgi:hypothetical protein